MKKPWNGNYPKRLDEKRDDGNPEDPALDMDKLVVFWVVDKEKVTGEDTKQVQVVAASKTVNCGRAILICKDQSPQAKKEEEKSFIQMEIFTLDDLQVNITHHRLVPKHEVLATEEKQELLEKYRIKEHQLPKIYAHDPVARYFGVSRGTVIKITRDSATAGRYVTYRTTI